MTREEYIKGKIESGHTLHQNNDVWWETTRNGYCKPAIPFDEVKATKAKPAMSKSFIGCNHRVPNKAGSSGYWLPFVLDEQGIKEWSLEGLKSGNRRRRIRKGLRNCEVKRLENVQTYRSDFSRILKSTAIRNGHGNPPEHYNEDKQSWWDLILRVNHYTEFWGAFHEGMLVAYICFHVAGDRVVVDGVKSDTEWLQTCPIDAILFNFITDIQKREGIKEMIYGGKSDRPSLDKFKESYGFRIEEIPYRIGVMGGYLYVPKFVKRMLKRTPADA